VKFAAGVLPYCPSTKRFLISKRGPQISNPNVWTNFGGGSQDGESPIQTAVREFREESGYRGKVRLIKSYPTKNQKDGITFFNFIGLVSDEFKPTTIGKKTVDGSVEVSSAKWVNVEQIYNLNPGILHPGFFKFLNLAKNQLQGIGLNEMNSSLQNLLQRLDENTNHWEDEVDLTEENVTSNLDGGAGPQKTPFAFSKKVKDPDDVSYSEPVMHTERFYKKIEDSYNRLQGTITEINYNDYKSDPSKTTTQKINSNILEINKKLREVEQMINHAAKLKTESGSDQTVFWKGTVGSFLKIKERLNRLSNKIVEFNS